MKHAHARQNKPPRWDAGPRIRCLLTPVHPERSLSLALSQHLSLELPDVEFVLKPQDELDAVWVCGYEPGAHDLIRKLREETPRALLLVTGKGKVEVWKPEVLAAGADFALGWPIPFSELSRILHRQSVQD